MQLLDLTRRFVKSLREASNGELDDLYRRLRLEVDTHSHNANCVADHHQEMVLLGYMLSVIHKEINNRGL